jgi:cobalt-zinc-cadmium efflux system membrane fusion protein
MNKKASPTWTLIGACLASAALAGGAVYFSVPYWSSASVAQGQDSAGEGDGHGHEGEEEEGHEEEGEEVVVTLPKEMWEASKLNVEPVTRQTVNIQTWATGKLTLNEDRSANIYSITEGRAHEVSVNLGDRVDEGQTLAIIDSREVGTAKLELYQARLQQKFAKQANDFAQRVKTNALQLIEALDRNASAEEIEKTLGDRPIGKYREQLLGAYTALVQAQTDFDRIEPIANTGAIAGKQLIEARANLNTAKASFNAVLEQLRFAVPQDALEAEQAVQQAQQAVEVAKAKLNILGYEDAELEDIQPDQKAGHISHYEVVAPFAGSIIAKNVVLAERVGTDTEMFRLADLSTVWVQADIYQKDLPAIAQLGDTLTFRAPTASDGSLHTHTAKIFYRGDVLDPDTRTLRLQAVAGNEDRHLKPGMFVEIEIPSQDSQNILAIPESAIQEVEDKKVVFVQQSETEFRKVPVVTGTLSDGIIEIRQGLKVGDKVVTSGGFALKSELMKGEIGHGH